MQGIGLAYSQAVSRVGCSCQVLTSRSGHLPLDELLILAEQGTTAFVVRADAGNEEASGAVLAWARESLPPVKHYAHAAGISGFDFLADMPDAKLWDICKPKVDPPDWHCLHCILLKSK